MWGIWDCRAAGLRLYFRVESVGERGFRLICRDITCDVWLIVKETAKQAKVRSYNLMNFAASSDIRNEILLGLIHGRAECVKTVDSLWKTHAKFDFDYEGTVHTSTPSVFGGVMRLFIL